jgi:hypothetical protein
MLNFGFCSLGCSLSDSLLENVIASFEPSKEAMGGCECVDSLISFLLLVAQRCCRSLWSAFLAIVICRRFASSGRVFNPFLLPWAPADFLP